MFDGLPALVEGHPTHEQTLDLLTLPGVRIERIISTGQSSPPGFWYEQAEAEWVLLVSGAAELRFADKDATRALKPGDYVFIAPGRRHRVESTAAEEPTVWLAIWIGPAG